MKVHEFQTDPHMWKLAEQGVKTCECGIGDRAQRVRPGDTLQLRVGMANGEVMVLERRVGMVRLYERLAQAKGDFDVTSAGFYMWEELEATLRKSYGYRVDREPFTVMYLGAMP